MGDTTANTEADWGWARCAEWLVERKVDFVFDAHPLGSTYPLTLYRFRVERLGVFGTKGKPATDEDWRAMLKAWCEASGKTVPWEEAEERLCSTCADELTPFEAEPCVSCQCHSERLNWTPRTCENCGSVAKYLDPTEPKKRCSTRASCALHPRAFPEADGESGWIPIDAEHPDKWQAAEAPVDIPGTMRPPTPALLRRACDHWDTRSDGSVWDMIASAADAWQQDILLRDAARRDASRNGEAMQAARRERDAARKSLEAAIIQNRVEAGRTEHADRRATGLIGERNAALEQAEIAWGCVKVAEQAEARWRAAMEAAERDRDTYMTQAVDLRTSRDALKGEVAALRTQLREAREAESSEGRWAAEYLEERDAARTALAAALERAEAAERERDRSRQDEIRHDNERRDALAEAGNLRRQLARIQKNLARQWQLRMRAERELAQLRSQRTEAEQVLADLRAITKADSQVTLRCHTSAVSCYPVLLYPGSDDPRGFGTRGEPWTADDINAARVAVCGEAPATPPQTEPEPPTRPCPTCRHQRGAYCNVAENPHGPAPCPRWQAVDDEEDGEPSELPADVARARLHNLSERSKDIARELKRIADGRDEWGGGNDAS